METRSQLLAQIQHQSKVKSELGLEPGPYAASHTASSQILNRSRPSAERAGSEERGYRSQREERRSWDQQGLTAQICSAARKSKGFDSLKLNFFNLFSQEMRGS